MIFEQFASGGCRSYLIGCPDSCAAALIDPEVSQIDRYEAVAVHDSLRIRYVIDSHTHADHFSAAHEIGKLLGVPVVMHRDAPAPFADLRLLDGDMLLLGDIRLQVIHTPGHTRDSMCLLAENRLFTGDTLLHGATGRTDLPTGDPHALFDSLFNGILKLDPALSIFPAHDYKNIGATTIAEELATNPRLAHRNRDAFVETMQHLNLAAPTHLTEALRTNLSGGKTVARLLAEAAARTPFMSLHELHARTMSAAVAPAEATAADLVVLDVREKEAYDKGHVSGARHLPRGQLELRVNEELPDPTARIVTVCEYGKISTLAAATLRELGFMRTSALDGGMQAWRENGYPLETSCQSC